jgi:hypothetical protein
MLKLLRAGIALIVLMPAWAGVDTSTAESLLRKSGVWAQMGDVSAQVRRSTRAAAAQGRSRPTETESERLSRAIDSAYSAQELRSMCVAAVSKDLGKDHVGALLRWYDGAKGRRITKLEEAQAGRDTESVDGQGMLLLKIMPPHRRRILDEIALASRSAEWMTEIAIGTTLATEQAAASASPGTPRPSLRDIKDALEANRHAYMRNFTAMAIAGAATTYAPLSDTELEDYVVFLKSEAGRHYNAVAGRAITDAMLRAATVLGRALPGVKDKSTT